MICYMPILWNISFWLVLGLPNGPQGGSVLPKWDNRGLILVFMILGHFSLTSSQDNRSNGMLHAYITKNENFINSGHVGNGTLGETAMKKNCPTTHDVAKNSFWLYYRCTFQKWQKIPYGLHVQVSHCCCWTMLDLLVLCKFHCHSMR